MKTSKFISLVIIFLTLFSCNERDIAKKAEEPFVGHIKDSHLKNLQQIDTLSFGYRISTYKNDSAIEENLLSIGQLGFLERSQDSTEAFGQWFYFTGEYSYLYKTGFFKKGQPDSIWINLFDDYPIPRMAFLRNNKMVNYEGSVNLFDHQGRPWIRGEKIRINNLPQGKWKTYRYDLIPNLCFEWEFNLEGDSVVVGLKQIEIESKKIVSSNEFKVEYDTTILYDYSYLLKLE